MGAHISLSPGGRTATLTVDTDLDNRSRPAVESAVAGLPVSVRRLTLDLTGVAFADSSLLYIVHVADRSVARNGGLLKVSGLGPQPRRLLVHAAELWPEGGWQTYLAPPLT
jgi:anti-anti-sigma regulatory factor